ncbi:MAG TPA: aminodeoxychorismate synthase component I [Propionibacteriaceae bacterium]|nr:aminodeoxychorismate synthase component I [Micropruina sp.]HBX80492.1 aminodeoxychorismate synthase component I [Propionibacteriaceae bacterium]HBY23043.1 aminodeoxychorismate synthase component I [Propionibacteriaceae bacterium]
MILLEAGPHGPVAFDHPVEVVVATTIDEVVPALAHLDDVRAAGLWVAGWIGYEAGYAFEPRLQPLVPTPAGPLLAFGVFAHPTAPLGWPSAPDAIASPPGDGDVWLSSPRPRLTPPEYAAAFACVHDHIERGDCYQANLTFPLDARLHGTPSSLDAALRALQPVAYGAYVDLGVGPILISRSPELFFAVDADRSIRTRPMKGTAPRSSDPRVDRELAANLARDPKIRAENLMIVDLMRNDLSRVARPGSVHVPELFAVDTLATVHQLSSTVAAVLADPPTLGRLLPALFPCGSITGAPKVRAMEILAEVEPFPRGAYCGSIGWMAPNGSACFNVAIRTLSLTGDRVVLNAGGGIVADSTAAGEWEEALWKTAFVNGLVRG